MLVSRKNYYEKEKRMAQQAQNILHKDQYWIKSHFYTKQQY
jgi:hypothetical protein